MTASSSPRPSSRDHDARFLSARAIVDTFEHGQAERSDRKKRGVFYTPVPLVDAMIDRLEQDGALDEGLLVDPAAGAGAFVVALVDRLGPALLDRLLACDIDPAALDACAQALHMLLGPSHASRIDRWRRDQAHVMDFLTSSWPAAAPALIVGNPPYGRVPGATYGDRFPMLGGEPDLYGCFLLRSTEIMAPQGRTALLVPDSWLTNTRDGILRKHLLETTGIDRIVDFGKPFAEARDTRVHMAVVRRGATACRVESERDGALAPMATVDATTLAAQASEGWFLYRTASEARACEALSRGGRPLATLFDVRYGLRTGDNATHLRPGPGATPMVGGGDLDAFDRRHASRHLVDPAPFQTSLRGQHGRFKIGIQRIRTNSRTPWRRWLEAAPLTPDEAGLDSLTLISTPRAKEMNDDLCALLGVINSSLLNRWYKLHFTDVNIKPAYLRALPVPPTDKTLAQLVRRRLEQPGAIKLERAIDRLVAHAYGLDGTSIEELEKGYWADALAERPMPTLAEARAME